MLTDSSQPSKPTTRVSAGSKPAAGSAPESLAVTPRRPRRVPSWVRFSVPVIIVGGAAILESLAWFRNSGDATMQVMLSWYILPASVFLFVLWWLFLSGFAWKLRLAVFGVVAAGVVAFFSYFRLKEFRGDMVPRFESRWQESAEQKAADYWKSHGALSPTADRTPNSSAEHLTKVADFPVKPGDWAQFEGPNRDGIAHGVRVRTDWEQRPPQQVWKHPVGAGWSAFAVVGGFAFTQEQRGEDEAAVCYDAQTGQQVWAHLDHGQRYSNAMAGVGPRATPTVSGSRVYTFGTSGILNCLDPHSGAVLWSHNAVKEAGVPPLQFGMSGSPLVYDNVVVVNPGGPRSKIDDTQTGGRAVVAYDRLTGKQVWASGDYQAAYASPILATIGGVRQIVVYDAVGAGGYDAATGKELWRSPEWTNQFDNNIAQPIILADGSVFLSSGYGTGSILLDVKNSGSGWSVTTRWTAPNKFKLKFNTGVHRDGFVYGLDEGILACLDLKTGKHRWKSGHYGYGQVLLLDNSLLVVSENGDLILVDVSPGGGREIARFHAIDGKTWNHPALSGSRLFVRDGEEAACYDLGPLQTASR
jgi:outer membrane protein assembly factor BamB